MSIQDILTKRRIRLLTKRLRAMNNVCDIKFVGRCEEYWATKNTFRFLVAFDGELPYPWGWANDEWDSSGSPPAVIDEEGYHTLIAEKYYGEWIFLLLGCA